MKADYVINQEQLTAVDELCGSELFFTAGPRKERELGDDSPFLHMFD